MIENEYIDADPTARADAIKQEMFAPETDACDSDEEEPITLTKNVPAKKRKVNHMHAEDETDMKTMRILTITDN